MRGTSKVTLGHPHRKKNNRGLEDNDNYRTIIIIHRVLTMWLLVDFLLLFLPLILHLIRLLLVLLCDNGNN